MGLKSSHLVAQREVDGSRVRFGRGNLGGDRFSSTHWAPMRTATNRSTSKGRVGAGPVGWAGRPQHRWGVWSPEKAQVRSTPLPGTGPQGRAPGTGDRAEGEPVSGGPAGRALCPEVCAQCGAEGKHVRVGCDDAVRWQHLILSVAGGWPPQHGLSQGPVVGAACSPWSHLWARGRRGGPQAGFSVYLRLRLRLRGWAHRSLTADCPSEAAPASWCPDTLSRWPGEPAAAAAAANAPTHRVSRSADLWGCTAECWGSYPCRGGAG